MTRGQLNYLIWHVSLSARSGPSGLTVSAILPGLCCKRLKINALTERNGGDGGP